MSVIGETTVRDLAVDSTDDLVISGGDFQFVSGIDSIVSAVKALLQFFEGEWFLDQVFGVPYFQEILIKNPSFILIRSLLIEAIESVPGILGVTSFSMEYNQDRSLTVTYSADSDLGAIDSVIQVSP